MPKKRPFTPNAQKHLAELADEMRKSFINFRFAIGDYFRQYDPLARRAHRLQEDVDALIKELKATPEDQ